jgi:hypothetical protein
MTDPVPRRDVFDVPTMLEFVRWEKLPLRAPRLVTALSRIFAE